MSRNENGMKFVSEQLNEFYSKQSIKRHIAITITP